MSLDPSPNIHPGHGQGPAGASMSDLLSAVKNVALAISNLQQILLSIAGATTDGARALTGPTLIKQGPGRVAKVTVVAETGTGPAGQLIDSNSAAATGPVIYSVPGAIGTYDVNLPFSFGLVVIPTAGDVLTVSYS